LGVALTFDSAVWHTSQGFFICFSQKERRKEKRKKEKGDFNLQQDQDEKGPFGVQEGLGQWRSCS